MKKKKKKKRSPNICYLDDLRKWVNLAELLAYHNESITQMKDGPKPKEVSILTEAIYQFFEDEGGFVSPVATERGWYVGLVTFLVNEGFKKEKVVMEMLSGDFLTHIQNAWRLYRKAHPRKISKLEDEYVSPTGEYIGDNDKKKRAKIFNHPTTSVVRWMGTDYWDFEEARDALKAMGADISDVTIRIQLKAGRTGERGPPAKLSEEEIGILYECMNKNS